MEYLVIFLLAAGTFLLCFLADKLFQKVFRSNALHRSGKAVRFSKKYGSFGMIAVLLGISSILAGLSNGWALIAGGVILVLVGAGLIVYYLTFGIYYDSDSFLYTAFGKKSLRCTYGQISHQQLYILQGGSILLDLYLKNGSTVPVQLSLAGAEDFLNTAFLGWVRQNNIDIRNTDFHDPQKSCWFPSQEE